MQARVKKSEESTLHYILRGPCANSCCFNDNRAYKSPSQGGPPAYLCAGLRCLAFTVHQPYLAAVRPHHRRQITISVTLSVLVPKLAPVLPHLCRQVAVSVPFVVLPPRLVTIGEHNRWQVAVTMPFSVAVPPLVSVWKHNCRQVVVSMQPSVGIAPREGPGWASHVLPSRWCANKQMWNHWVPPSVCVIFQTPCASRVQK
jgi:hypothetical protein